MTFALGLGTGLACDTPRRSRRKAAPIGSLTRKLLERSGTLAPSSSSYAPVGASTGASLPSTGLAPWHMGGASSAGGAGSGLSPTGVGGAPCHCEPPGVEPHHPQHGGITEQLIPTSALPHPKTGSGLRAAPPVLPHPSEHAWFWLWHPRRRTWFQIAPAPHGHVPHLVAPHLVPAHWPPMHILPRPVRHLSPVPPPEPPASHAHLPHLVPAHKSASATAASFVDQFMHHMGAWSSSTHMHFSPGHWLWQKGEWWFVEPINKITTTYGNAVTNMAAGGQGRTKYHVSLAPLAAFGPRPPHIVATYFWPNSVGHMVDAHGRSPSNAATVIVLPPHVRLARGSAIRQVFAPR